MDEAIQTALRLRHAALSSGLEPYRIQFPLDHLIPTAFLLAGMVVEYADVERITVLARPAKVGRYECVPPTRFEA